ncbi:MAG: acetyl-CoA carboxylase biotin carboxylase subunit [Clostridiales bacterium]|nr:acetyl-CoA carboxylase biotin carboxylase subunit [Clostridiales bacterium]
MIRKVLIANRGEIAVRIIRACKELGIKTVAIYSEADKDALHTQLADEAICVGKPRSKDSYLNISNIISAAVITKCNAIHPGFGFLSENDEFASICEECNIKFIGPRSETLSLMGDKARAREIMKGADVPVIPGSDGLVNSIEDAYKEAKRIGYPVMIKAALGGGGKGIRIVYNEEELENAYFTAKSEAKTNFGDDSMYVEKFIENPRHIEFQILGDEFGNIIHLGERDCTIQRKNQKVLEEAPSPILNEDLRREMGRVAVNAAKAVNYVNAGTIEFLVDKYNNFYFMEMNTRIQVEHPITEMVSSIDIVKEQINIANGDRLSISQEDVEIKGHAIECRINAENPYKGFIPSPGKIKLLNLPGGNGIRVDTAVYQGYNIPPTYDSMIAKLISYGKTREEAINKMLRALEEFVVDGIDSNIEFQIEILNNEKFRLGNYDTSFISKEYNL